MMHIFNPHRESDPANRVHAIMSMNQTHTLCGMGQIWKRAADGNDYQQYFPTGKPIDCHGCTKALELVVRNELGKLSSVQLEAVIEFTTKLRAESDA